MLVAMRIVPNKSEPCAVCGCHDARALVSVTLRGGATATLCGSHELMYRRSRRAARTVAELRAAFGERREASRRDDREGDELAEQLAAAFTTERRRSDRRAS